MTLDEKIGQMNQPDQEFLASLSDIAAYLGSIPQRQRSQRGQQPRGLD